MLLENFVEIAIEKYYDCYIWDSNKEENIFTGSIGDIPDELLEHEVTSWEITDGKIGFNIE